MERILITYDIVAGTESVNESLHSAFKDALKRVGFQDYLDSAFVSNISKPCRVFLPNTTLVLLNSDKTAAKNKFDEIAKQKGVKVLKVFTVEFSTWLGQPAMPI